MRKALDHAPLIGVVLLLGFVALRLSACSAQVAPTPALFSDAITLDAALQKSAETGTPIFVVATADWCPPCQAYKKGALADESVAGLIRDKTIPVYVDVDDDPDAANMLGVSSIPASFIITDGAITARVTGARSAGDLKSWINANTAG